MTNRELEERRPQGRSWARSIDGGDHGSRTFGALALAAALAATGLVGCGPSNSPRTVPVGESRPFVGDGVDAGVSEGERFGFGTNPGAAMGATAGSAGGVTSGVAPTAFDYDLPEGWTTRATTSMRVVNLVVARDPRAECSLVLLGGDGGGLKANVDRWRGQMGLAPMSAVEFAALDHAPLLGQDAVRIDFAGAYSGMGGEAMSGYRMLGLIAVSPGGSAFLKFTGPADVVGAEVEAFYALGASLRPAGTAATGAAPSADATAADTATPGGTVPAGTREVGETLSWIAPASWKRGGPRMMREVTFTTDASGATECYISSLGGDGGGIRSNFDRWRGQMGAEPLNDLEVAELPRIDSLGTQAILIEISGSFTGMGGEQVQDALMLGAVIALDDRTIFVKLIGPAASAAAERENFRAFLASLETVD
ncbi:hypothetical protein Pla163_33040 [Planctomycetes bacterium Pla163]|uniref:Uncharacterized protein n=1 Tax=Rohdeia mirabilis TaxID=2528008 RepID=A0A518D3V0_9BACT|nr:hypothetical protein Pla163_33040 [Planctomycetes bacterium Pla163]